VIVNGVQDDPDGNGAAVYAGDVEGVFEVTGVTVLFFSMVPVHPAHTARIIAIVTMTRIIDCL
jgi:hypothetical protein